MALTDKTTRRKVAQAVRAKATQAVRRKALTIPALMSPQVRARLKVRRRVARLTPLHRPKRLEVRTTPQVEMMSSQGPARRAVKQAAQRLRSKVAARRWAPRLKVARPEGAHPTRALRGRRGLARRMWRRRAILKRVEASLVAASLATSQTLKVAA